MLQVGTKAPDFTLSSTPDQTVSLSELRGKRVCLFFYPADWSPVCGDELNIVNVGLPLFSKANAQVIGISVDGAWSHDAFAKARSLHFPLLADYNPKGKVSKEYEAYDEEGGHSNRTIYLIDEEGIIRWAYQSPVGVNPGIDGVLKALNDLK